MFERLRTDRSLQDDAYDPPFSDFNLVIDNHGTAINVTVPVATARIKFRYSAKIDPAPIRAAVHEAAARHGMTVTEAEEGTPPELPADHPFVRRCVDASGQPRQTAPFGTDASILQTHRAMRGDGTRRHRRRAQARRGGSHRRTCGGRAGVSGRWQMRLAAAVKAGARYGDQAPVPSVSSVDWPCS